MSRVIKIIGYKVILKLLQSKTCLYLQRVLLQWQVRSLMRQVLNKYQSLVWKVLLVVNKLTLQVKCFKVMKVLHHLLVAHHSMVRFMVKQLRQCSQELHGRQRNLSLQKNQMLQMRPLKQIPRQLVRPHLHLKQIYQQVVHQKLFWIKKLKHQLDHHRFQVLSPHMEVWVILQYVTLRLMKVINWKTD